MAYFAKETILASYKTLSTIGANKEQGLTQKVSAIKYMCALDMYFQQNGSKCDLKTTANRDLFAQNVGVVVKINEKYCTKDFYLNIGSNGRDYDCGSNFYSQSSVKDSKSNPTEIVFYPKRSGWKPVLKVVNQELHYDASFVSDSIPYYLPLTRQKKALIIWLLRNEEIESLAKEDLRNKLLGFYTETLVSGLFVDEITDEDFSSYQLSDNVSELNIEDIKNIFKTKYEFDFDKKQVIYYGAPGTGKSYKVNQISKQYSTIRTTFHPDSDYSTFVGAYKPTMSKVRRSVIIGQDEKEVKPLPDNPKYDSKIQYSFVKQAFLKAYLVAWKKFTEPTTNAEGKEEVQPQFLVIEEINRGNCAQIFGDLFQLLDRQKNGFSCYPIDADDDLRKEIENAFKNEKAYQLVTDITVDDVVECYISNYQNDDGTLCTLSEDIQSGRVLLLPNNLYIWATMNTSDQSLFPIDSAFKRRWDWEYVRIAEGRDKVTHEPLRYSFSVKGTNYDWWSFIQKINERIGSITSSEDKKLGYFFCSTEDGMITADKFVGKVCFYLWNDVFKDFGFGKKEQSTPFKKEDGKDITFDDFYKEDAKEFKTVVDEDLLERFIKNLGVMTVEERSKKEKGENTTNQTDASENQPE